jgi:hypothetical protein
LYSKPTQLALWPSQQRTKPLVRVTPPAGLRMDIFNTVVSAIDLADRVWKLIDNFQKVPERLRRLQFDVKSLQQTLERLKETDFRGKEQGILLESEIYEIQATLRSLQRSISQQRQKPTSGVLSRSFRTFKAQLKLNDLDELAAELQKRKASLSLTINMLVLGTVGNVDAIVQHAMAAATMEPQNASRGTAVQVTNISRKEFLENLNAPNYAEDQIRVKSPAEGTATWIYDRPEYKTWYNSPGSKSLHLIGKMGSGKSVLMKSIIQKLKQNPTRGGCNESAVLYYFCSCVNRTDNPSSILRGFISQFVVDREDIYEASLSGSELLQSRRSGDSAGWSFEALWHIFTRVIQFSGLSSLYCIIDALDECDSTTLDEFLDLLHQLSKNALVPNMSIKLLFSSREYTRILDSLDCDGTNLRLFINPEAVSSDIRIAMHNDIDSIQRRLKLRDDEVGILQESILKKSDGMFLWVSLATKDIMENSYDATFETLEELIDDLPAGLKGLYEKNWVKLIELLPTAKVSLANKVLTWVLLAERPLTVSELTMALAIELKREAFRQLKNYSGISLLSF